MPEAAPTDRFASAPPVLVLEPHDVILAEVTVRPHLEYLQWHLARAGQAMHVARRDVGRFVLAQRERLLRVVHLSGALHHNLKNKTHIFN